MSAANTTAIPSAATLDWLAKLISHPSVSLTPNLALIEQAQSYLESLGYLCAVVFDETRSKANLYATIGPAVDGGVILSGHSDVVPVEGQNWASDPFTTDIRGDKLYGRGACDMKGFLACLLAKAETFKNADLRVPIHLAFTYDEEVGCLGVPSLVEAINALPHKPAMCIVGEPTNMQVITQHKGKYSARAHFTGRSGHSSLPGEGVNAVEFASEFVVFLRRLGQKFRNEGPHDDEFVPNHTTFHSGVIHGGTQLNIIPQNCYVDFEFRNLPNHDRNELKGLIFDYLDNTLIPQMRETYDDVGVEIEVVSDMPGLATGDDEEVTRLVMELTGANTTGKVSFGTEAGVFSAMGDIPTVVCGPGSIEQAHKPDEFIELDQLARCEAFLDKLLAVLVRK
ncbi:MULTISPECIES: acetylornithine deacetylase [Thalassospira]|uniref:acetylornithine deacetylase n=1 Tax=Thalassospira TaxID=168934 RepID=UPI0008DCEF5F|nr:MULTISPECIES: acetylornithine deacetylase [Thalassospira]MAB33768.1 acetylornithine deacetylase [Thalassospira sp.]MDM7977133.1 acetylornithine deacetylase [Thalassospira xiamenensis]OHY99091.1 acetylornithine deacetylase (ArgE) [Thalassospira sp. MIT1004]HBS22208.1 acetylornithine deacetylase [Thalassospira sp.]